MNYEKSWVLHIKPSVPKIIKKFSRVDAQSILAVIESLVDSPYFGDIQKIKGEENVWRRRVGSFRIFYEIHPTLYVVHVFHIERRNSKTY